MIGRLSFSARMKSSSTWPLMAWSIDTSPTWPMCRPGWSAATAAVVSSTASMWESATSSAAVPVALPDVELHRHHRRAPVVGADQPADVRDCGQRGEPLAQVASSGLDVGVRELLTARCLDEHALGEVGRVAGLLDGEVRPAGRPGAHLAVGEQPGTGRTAADDRSSDEQHPQQQCLPAVPDAPPGQPLGGAGTAAGRRRGRRGAGRTRRRDDSHGRAPSGSSGRVSGDVLPPLRSSGAASLRPAADLGWG